MSTPPERELTEEEIAQLQEQLARVTVEDMVLEMVVSLINLGMSKAPDWEQVKAAIDAARALMPTIEAQHGDKLGPVREALSQMQMAYVKNTQGGPEEPEKPAAEGPGPAQSTGRLWVPGQ